VSILIGAIALIGRRRMRRQIPAVMSWQFQRGLQSFVIASLDADGHSADSS
jgi:hypothetical protein